MFKIQKGVAIPEQFNSGSRRAKEYLYPFPDMEVGDSFQCPDNMGKNSNGKSKRRDSLYASNWGYRKREAPEKQFLIRYIDEETIGCWRIK